MDKETAKKVLHLLNEQKAFFEMRKRNLPEASTQLQKCKKLEAEMRAECEEALKDNSQTSMF
jgi:hypothetical protein